MSAYTRRKGSKRKRQKRLRKKRQANDLDTVLRWLFMPAATHLPLLTAFVEKHLPGQ